MYEVAFGDGGKLEVLGKGIVLLNAVLAELSHSFQRQSKMVKLLDLINDSHINARGVKCGNLYYLDCCPKSEVNDVNHKSQEDLWRKRYGHLSVKEMYFHWLLFRDQGTQTV